MFKNLKSLFIVEDEKPATNPVKNKPKTSTKKNEKSSPAPQNTPTEPRNTDGGKITPKFTDTLLKAIEANNIDGFDYLEYKQAIKGTADMSMSEEMRYKSAFAVAKTMGVTADHLIKSAKYYVGILDKEEQKFLNTVQRQLDQHVTQRKNNIAKLQQAIDQKNQQIEQLKKQIEQHQAQHQKIKSEVTGVQDKILNTKDDFQASHQHLKTQLENDIQKIQQYLTEK